MEKLPTYWPKMAMEECIAMGVHSSYYRYLSNIKETLNVFGNSPTQIKNIIHQAAVTNVLSQQRVINASTFAMSKPNPGGRYQWFKTKSWVNDSERCKIYNEFRSCNSGLGNRGPTKNGHFFKMCPLCQKRGIIAINNEVLINISKSFI